MTGTSVRATTVPSPFAVDEKSLETPNSVVEKIFHQAVAPVLASETAMVDPEATPLDNFIAKLSVFRASPVVRR